MCHTPDGDCEGLAVRLHQPRRERPRSSDADLLTQDCTNEQLGAVGMCRCTQAGTLGDQGCEQRVGAEVLADLRRVGIEVEQTAGTLHRRLNIGDVVEYERARDRVTRDRDGHHTVAACEAE